MIFDYSSLLLLLLMLNLRPALGAGIGSSLSSSVSTSIIGDIWGGIAIPPDAGTTVMFPLSLKQQAEAVIYNLHMFPLQVTKNLKWIKCYSKRKKIATNLDQTHQLFSFNLNPVPFSLDLKIHRALRITDHLSGEMKDTVKLQRVFSKEEYTCGSFVMLDSVMISQTCMTLRRIWRLMRG